MNKLFTSIVRTLRSYINAPAPVPAQPRYLYQNGQTRFARPELAEVRGCPVFCQVDHTKQEMVYTGWDNREFARLSLRSATSYSTFFEKEWELMERCKVEDYNI